MQKAAPNGGKIAIFVGQMDAPNAVERRQGLLEGIWCLYPEEKLSPGQAHEIDRVYALHRDLSDDDFVAEHRARWLA